MVSLKEITAILITFLVHFHVLLSETYISVNSVKLSTQILQRRLRYGLIFDHCCLKNKRLLRSNKKKKGEPCIYLPRQPDTYSMLYRNIMTPMFNRK